MKTVTVKELLIEIEKIENNRVDNKTTTLWWIKGLSVSDIDTIKLYASQISENWFHSLYGAKMKNKRSYW